MFGKRDARMVARAALDAISAAQERIAEDDARLVGIQVTLVIRLPNGKIRMIGVTQERIPPERTK